MTHPQQPTAVPVYVVVPPRVLLLDAAGPVEVLRKANLEQQALRFDVSYVGPRATVASSIGLALTEIAPLPKGLPQGALVVIAGSADEPMGPAAEDREADARDEETSLMPGRIAPASQTTIAADWSRACADAAPQHQHAAADAERPPAVGHSGSLAQASRCR